MSSHFSELAKRGSALFLFVVAFNTLHAQDHQITKTYFEHLSTINKEWNNHTDASVDGSGSFSSDEERIQFHLNLVIKSLTDNEPQAFSTGQLENRRSLLGALEIYAETKIFPTNSYHCTRTPYFVDDYDVHCAVGYLIAESGYNELVSKIRTDHNYDYIKDIKTEGLVEWTAEHGFTVEELKWIQPNYSPTTVVSPLAGGTNGPVNKLYTDVTNGRVIFAGNFSEVDSLPCLNIGIYENNQLSCFGGGVAGVIQDVWMNTDGVYVFGALEYNGFTYPAALYDGTSWSFISIPTREGATCTASHSGVSGIVLEMAISHSSIPGLQELWFLSDLGVWEKKAKVNGIIYDIEASGYGQVFGGRFNIVSYYIGGVLDASIWVNNVVIKEDGLDTWFGLPGAICDTVKVINTVGGTIYIGGSATANPNVETPCLSKFVNTQLETLLTDESFYNASWCSINAIQYDLDDDLILGGEFGINPMIGEYGKNLARYRIQYQQVAAYGFLDYAVNSLVYYNQEIYLGGLFTSNLSPMSVLNHLGRIDNVVGIEEVNLEQAVISPNPFERSFTIDGAPNDSQYSILDIHGKLVSSGDVEEGKVIEVFNLMPGTYILKLESVAGVSTQRIVKQ